MAPLPHHDLRHPWLRYQVEGYDEGIIHSYEHILEMIFRREVNWVHVLDFVRLTNGMRQTLADRLSMVYTGDDRQAVFTSHAWRGLFEIRGPLVREFMLEFFSTYRMSDTEMGLNVVDTLCFKLGGARCMMTLKQFISALGLHTEGEMAEAGDFLGAAPSYVHIRDPVRRLCYKMIACSISGRGQGVEKVTGFDLLYLRTMDHGTANVPYLLAQYLFRHADRRKSGSRLSRGNFIGHLTAHFGLVASGPERQQTAVAGAPRVAKDAPTTNEGAQADPAPVIARSYRELYYREDQSLHLDDQLYDIAHGCQWPYLSCI
ncbi:hypothetical protein Tco_1003621 [Tanacetum coccineum]|uniref:Uncharacterized protein n=1 Tax=Tanacetum coccineum TaxID=301880 RepID=A0ABQ5F9L3_9ASTR